VAKRSVGQRHGRAAHRVWGFKRNMGRVWAVLYLSPEPLTAQDLRDLLRLSSGAVSMILSDLSRWGSYARYGSRVTAVTTSRPRCSCGA